MAVTAVRASATMDSAALWPAWALANWACASSLLRGEKALVHQILCALQLPGCQLELCLALRHHGLRCLDRLLPLGQQGCCGVLAILCLPQLGLRPLQVGLQGAAST